jgi:hypothetical protein
LLVWIYVAWVIVLLGAVMTAYLPSLLAGVVRPAMDLRAGLAAFHSGAGDCASNSLHHVYHLKWPIQSARTVVFGWSNQGLAHKGMTSATGSIALKVTANSDPSPGL